MLDPVTANFLGDNLRCWMQIQVGKGPQASEVTGIVKIGQTMTMVLGVKDDENKFDMMVRNCVAHDGQRAPIQLVDERGCVSRPKIMSPFKKVKNFDATANVLAFAYFQAFKFPDSMNVHFQCVVQVRFIFFVTTVTTVTRVTFVTIFNLSQVSHLSHLSQLTFVTIFNLSQVSHLSQQLYCHKSHKDKSHICHPFV